MEQLNTVDQFEKHALQVLDKSIGDYFLRSRGGMLNLNQEAFRKLRIRPRMLRNVSNIDLSTTILGEKISMPLGVSPMGNQRFAHPDGECATAKAVEGANTVFIQSSLSHSSLEEVAKAAPKAIKWFQVFLWKDRDFVLHTIRAAEQNGYKALVVTIDNPIYAKHETKKDSKPGNFTHPIFTDYYKNVLESELTKHLSSLSDSSVTWEDISWLKSQTKLPLVVKGVLTAEDALLCVEYGVDAVMVSNRGGRILHGTSAPIEVLPEVARAVNGKIEVYLDGGVREGLDVFRALALGANMVFTGRPLIWGLASGGEEGAGRVLDVLRKEIEYVFALTGCSNIEKVIKDMVVHESKYHNL